MNVRRVEGSAAELAPLVTASLNEGFGFAVRLAAELARGDFDLPGTAFGAHDFGAHDSGAHDRARLLSVGGLTPDP